ncbi:MAG: cobalamin biosynthesis protein [Dyella sp.]
MSARWLTLGIGCRRDVGIEAIEQAVHVALGERSLHDVRQIATLARKAHEPALVAFCQRHALPLLGIAPERIAALAPEAFNPSDATQRAFGIRGVSEPCALLGATHGALVAARVAHAGVTVAIATDTFPTSRSPKESPRED